MKNKIWKIVVPVATRNCMQERMQEMSKKSALVALVVLSILIFVAPGLAKNAVWHIDSEHSTARLFLASSRNPDATVNVGVARANGLVSRNADDFAMPDFDFTIYPADKTASLERFQQEQNNDKPGNKPDYTVISFKSTRVARVDKETFRVTGNLTLTYVERPVTYDPSEAYSGPVYGPAVTYSLRQEAVFEFHELNPSGAPAAKKGNAEWSAFSTISGENFPELLEAVSATNWPTFVADEHCVMPSTIGEDYSGPACTGETVEPAPRKDFHCEMPATVGEDFAGEVCTQTSSPVVITDQAEIEWERRHHGIGRPNQVVTNEVKIQLDLRLTEINSTAADRSGE
jgi:polyisoprenoid-binding protein YceI